MAAESLVLKRISQVEVYREWCSKKPLEASSLRMNLLERAWLEPNLLPSQIRGMTQVTCELLQEMVVTRHTREKISTVGINIEELKNDYSENLGKEKKIEAKINYLTDEEKVLFYLVVFRGTLGEDKPHLDFKRKVLRGLQAIDIFPQDLFCNLVFSDLTTFQLLQKGLVIHSEVPLDTDVFRGIILASSGLTKAAVLELMSGGNLGEGTQAVKDLLISQFEACERIGQYISCTDSESQNFEYFRERIRTDLFLLPISERQRSLLKLIRNTGLTVNCRMVAISLWSQVVGEKGINHLESALEQGADISKIFAEKSGWPDLISRAEKHYQKYPHIQRLRWMADYLKRRMNSQKTGFRGVDISVVANLNSTLSSLDKVHSPQLVEPLIGAEIIVWHLSQLLRAFESGSSFLNKPRDFIDFALGGTLSGLREVEDYKNATEFAGAAMSLTEGERQLVIGRMLKDPRILSEEFCHRLTSLMWGVAALSLENRIRKFIGIPGSLYELPETSFRRAIELDEKGVDNLILFLIQLENQTSEDSSFEKIKPILSDAIFRMEGLRKIIVYQQDIADMVWTALNHPSESTEADQRESAILKTIMRDLSSELVKLVVPAVVDRINVRLTQPGEIDLSDIPQDLVQLAKIFKLNTTHEIGEAFLRELALGLMANSLVNEIALELVADIVFAFYKSGVVNNVDKFGLDTRQKAYIDELEEGYTQQNNIPDTGERFWLAMGATMDPVSIAHRMMIENLVYLASKLGLGKVAIAVLLSPDNIKAGRPVTAKEIRQQWTRIALSDLKGVFVDPPALSLEMKDRGEALLEYRKRKIGLHAQVAGTDKWGTVSNTDFPQVVAESVQIFVPRGSDSTDWDLLLTILGAIPKAIIPDWQPGIISSSMARAMIDNGWNRLVAILLGPMAETIVRSINSQP